MQLYIYTSFYLSIHQSNASINQSKNKGKVMINTINLMFMIKPSLFSHSLSNNPSKHDSCHLYIDCTLPPSLIPSLGLSDHLVVGGVAIEE